MLTDDEMTTRRIATLEADLRDVLEQGQYVRPGNWTPARQGLLKRHKAIVQELRRLRNEPETVVNLPF